MTLLRPAVLALAALLLLLPLAGAAEAQSRQLTGAEIAEVLTGNTAVGDWEGARFRQLYREDGTTLHTRTDGARGEGIWRVSENGLYEESWDGGETWTAWTVRRVAGRLVFLGRDLPTTPFAVEPGDTTFEPG